MNGSSSIASSKERNKFVLESSSLEHSLMHLTCFECSRVALQLWQNRGLLPYDILKSQVINIVTGTFMIADGAEQGSKEQKSSDTGYVRTY